MCFSPALYLVGEKGDKGGAGPPGVCDCNTSGGNTPQGVNNPPYGSYTQRGNYRKVPVIFVVDSEEELDRLHTVNAIAFRKDQRSLYFKDKDGWQPIQVLFFTIRYDTIQYYTIRYDTIRYYTILYDMTLYDTIRYYNIRYDMILYDTIRYYTILYDMILYDTIRYYTILYDMILYDTIRYYNIRYDMILYDTITYYTILYDMILYDTTIYDTI
uniref:Uncharacterized protein n=1 Tax=Hucho hucho TaxID=62062 RepID=A0A4W5K9J6_9TELE